MAEERDEERDYVKEAAAIAEGRSMLLPEKAHLIALARHAEQSIRNTLLVSRLLSAVMLDAGREELAIPAGVLKEIADRGAYLAIEAVPGGHQVVRMRFRPRPTAPLVAH